MELTLKSGLVSGAGVSLALLQNVSLQENYKK